MFVERASTIVPSASQRTLVTSKKLADLGEDRLDLALNDTTALSALRSFAATCLNVYFADKAAFQHEIKTDSSNTTILTVGPVAAKH